MSGGEESPVRARIGPIRLSPGIPVREVFVFLSVTGIASVLSIFMGLMQPYIFTEMVHVPVDHQGRLAGQLMTVQQFMLMICVGFTGTAADKVGRKAMLVATMFGYSLCAVLYPLAASVGALFLIRMLVGFSASCHSAGGPPKIMDYPDNASRGKFTALVMVYTAILNATLIGGIGSHLPAWLHASGMSVAQAGRRVLWFAAVIGMLMVVFTLVFMMRDRPLRAPRVAAHSMNKVRNLFSGIREVLRYARTNRGFGMLLVTSFVIRTDTAVIASFLALWITTEGAHQGLSTIQALKIAGIAASIISAMAFVAPPILGALLDRLSRQTIYLASVAAAGAVLVCAPFVHQITGWSIYGLAFLIGLVENAQVISQQAFFGQEAPAHLRGTAYGLLAILGTLSVVLTSLLAGYLFDTMGPTAPFVVTGLLHLSIALAAALILIRRGGDARPTVVVEHRPSVSELDRHRIV